MSMVKTFSPSGWDFDMPVAAMLKVASSGYIGPNDLRAFTKRAGVEGANVFQKMMGNIKFAKDEIPVHLIAIGAKEYYGPNRNGDAFSVATLKQAHDTFVKWASWYRNHKNKPHQGHPCFGSVKASAYNVPMQRVELLCGLPATKAAAERIGANCQVADQEIEKLAKDEDLAVSMACRVPYDVCSGCQNKARTREEYCKEASCKYGGCYNNLTRLVKIAGDVHMLHVDNHDPCFFDISKVWRPADRIAYAGKADWVKAASDGFFGIDGAKIAAELEITAPAGVILQQDIAVPPWRRQELEAMVKLASAIALLEQHPGLWDSHTARSAFMEAVQPAIDFDRLGAAKGNTEKIAVALGALADCRVVLPLREFAKLTERAEYTKAAQEQLPGTYTRMLDDGSLPSALVTNTYAPAQKTASTSQRMAAVALTRTHGLNKSAVDERCQRAVLRQIPMESKSGFKPSLRSHESPTVEKLARDYACYKVAALHRIAGFDDEFTHTMRLAMVQDQVA